MMVVLNELRDRPVFICGHPKSGTSLLRNLLDSHPQLVTYPEETGFFRRFLPEARSLDLPSQLSLAEQKLLHIFEWNTQHPPAHQAGFPDRDYTAIDYQQVVSSLHHLANVYPVRHPGEVLALSVLAFGDVCGQLHSDVRWWVEKTPYNERFAKQIFSWWPQARCIHIVRDPRDNYASYSRKQTAWTPEFFADNWRSSTQMGYENQALFGEQQYRMLRYEDLALQPEQALRQVCDFLEIDDHPTLRVPTRMGVAWEGNSMFTDSFETISAAPMGRWQDELSRSDVAVIELICGRWMRYLEYHQESNYSLPTIGRVLYWKAKHFLYRLLKPRQARQDLWAAGDEER